MRTHYKGEIMNKYESITALYERRSELNLEIVRLEQDIAKSVDTPAKYGMLNTLSTLYYKSFELEEELKKVIDSPVEKPSFWNLVTKKK